MRYVCEECSYDFGEGGDLGFWNAASRIDYHTASKHRIPTG